MLAVAAVVIVSVILNAVPVNVRPVLAVYVVLVSVSASSRHAGLPVPSVFQTLLATSPGAAT